jgi:hypothetical protein
MISRERWLENKYDQYECKPLETITKMFVDTVGVLEQLLNSPDDLTSTGLAKEVIKCSRAFLEKIKE